MAKWYILHTASGSEKSVKTMIEDQVEKKNMQGLFKEIIVPVVEVPEIKRGKRIITEKKFMPGYILIKMQMTDDSWHLVKSVPKITGFLGGKTTPQSLSDTEVKRIFSQLEHETKTASISSLHNIGDKVQVIDGPFDSFSGLIEDVDVESQRLRVSVSIFGKATPIELSFTQVKKN